jgi:tRNA-binding EMAP/Myf-like protein
MDKKRTGCSSQQNQYVGTLISDEYEPILKKSLLQLLHITIAKVVIIITHPNANKLYSY